MVGIGWAGKSTRLELVCGMGIPLRQRQLRMAGATEVEFILGKRN
jgi:hypothetical protein